MLVNRLALVPAKLPKRAARVVLSEMHAVAAALQTQIQRDFKPLWGIDATVTVYASKDEVPLGVWPIFVQTALADPSDMGYHLDSLNQPLARVAYDPAHPTDWSLTASHEALEMLADPFGNRLVGGPTIDPEHEHDRVLYLLEICDPCEDTKYAYTIDGILVSDFITPAYHDPVHTSGARYSFTGAVTKPREVLSGGYLDWQDPARGYWFELYRDTPRARIKRTQRLAKSRSLREDANRGAAHYQRLGKLSGERVREAKAKRLAGERASKARAGMWS